MVRSVVTPFEKEPSGDAVCADCIYVKRRPDATDWRCSAVEPEVIRDGYRDSVTGEHVVPLIRTPRCRDRNPLGGCREFMTSRVDDGGVPMTPAPTASGDPYRSGDLAVSHEWAPARTWRTVLADVLERLAAWVRG